MKIVPPLFMVLLSLAAADARGGSPIQNGVLPYTNSENIPLLPEAGGASSEMGLYLLTATNARPENVTNPDGPIIYGTGLADDDRAKAWKQFFTQIVEAGNQQQGADFNQKLARKCLPGNTFCSVMVDVNLVGVGGIQEPRKVLVIVGTDLHDEDKYLFRSVCIYPTRETLVCRDWDTGRLITPGDKLNSVKPSERSQSHG